MNNFDCLDSYNILYGVSISISIVVTFIILFVMNNKKDYSDYSVMPKYHNKEVYIINKINKNKYKYILERLNEEILIGIDCEWVASVYLVIFIIDLEKAVIGIIEICTSNYIIIFQSNSFSRIRK